MIEIRYCDTKRIWYVQGTKTGILSDDILIRLKEVGLQGFMDGHSGRNAMIMVKNDERMSEDDIQATTQYIIKLFC